MQGTRDSGGVQSTAQADDFPKAASKIPKTLQSRGGCLAGGNSKHDSKNDIEETSPKELGFCPQSYLCPSKIEVRDQSSTY